MVKENKSPGVDGIPSKLLKEIIDGISIRLANFLICHLKRELFHQNGRKQILHHNYKNDRPVTLTSVLWKLLETFIRSHIVYFPLKMLCAHSHKLWTRPPFPFSIMALTNAGSVLARSQRHSTFLFSRVDILNDGHDYGVVLFISLECKHTDTFQSQV